MLFQFIGQTPLLLMTVVRRMLSTKDRRKRIISELRWTHAGKSEER
jgi:hypothetical protein